MGHNWVPRLRRWLLLSESQTFLLTFCSKRRSLPPDRFQTMGPFQPPCEKNPQWMHLVADMRRQDSTFLLEVPSYFQKLGNKILFTRLRPSRAPGHCSRLGLNSQPGGAPFQAASRLCQSSVGCSPPPRRGHLLSKSSRLLGQCLGL